MNIKPAIILAASLAASATAGQEVQLTPEEQEALQNFAMEINQTCAVPQLPQVPREDVTEEKLIAVQGDVKAFIDDGNVYLECLAEQEAAMGEDATDNQLALLAAMHNRVVENMQGVAADFNAALKSLKQE